MLDGVSSGPPESRGRPPSGTSASNVEARVRDALSTLYDPCSLATKRPVTIVELGLLRHVQVSENCSVVITLVTTSPGCLYYAQLGQAVTNVVMALPGIESVEVRLDATVPWTPADMAPELQAARRSQLVAIEGVRPQQWRLGSAALEG